MRTTPPARRGLTIIEVIVSLAILVIAGLGLAYAASSSVVSTRSAKPRFVAQQAAQRVIENLRATTGSLSTFYTSNWSGAALTEDPPASGNFYRDLDTDQAFLEIIAPALNASVMHRPASGAVLRLRFVSEATYNAALSTDVDLDFNGNTSDGIQFDGTGSTSGPAYQMYPIVVEVHWQDELGPQTYRQMAVIQELPDLDPARN